jgi:hypothetical protein
MYISAQHPFFTIYSAADDTHPMYETSPHRQAKRYEGVPLSSYKQDHKHSMRDLIKRAMKKAEKDAAYLEFKLSGKQI